MAKLFVVRLRWIGGGVLGGEMGRWFGGGGGGPGGSLRSVEGAGYGEEGGVRLARLFITDLEELGGCGRRGVEEGVFDSRDLSRFLYYVS